MKLLNIFHKQTLLFLGILLFAFGILDVFLKQSIASYTLVLAFFPLAYFVLFEEIKKNDERMKVLQQKASYNTLIISCFSLLVFYLLEQFTSLKIDYLFSFYSIFVISYTMNLLVLFRRY
ncbi:hypothetical protein GJU40_07660 [Bacillus lacus]|uniref:DUF3796 domain-containing protein n=1 Tax=Metabacillus lacus TaxID=1983721 RepID=A0A7X2IYB2_9BACI|nr:hypothetical protein [Metabacillus lacus]MRX72047.1 hypothetical protein [Metabacillus lacus]